MADNTIRRIIDRNVERHLVKEFLIENTKRAGFGKLEIKRTPQGTSVTLMAERPGLVIGRKGKIINELQRRLDEEFNIENPKLMVEEVENASLNAQIMAQKLASSLERGWYFRRAGHSTVTNIMQAGAKGVLVTLSGKVTGARHRTEKFIAGHVKFCGETALQHMDKGYAVAVKKLGTIGCTVAIMRPNTRLPHEITIYPKGHVPDEENVEVVEVEEAAPEEAKE
ncbi:MAG: 30S ribosomal protein S3 [Candidatus Poseidoniaceae archaeon]|jgi:small subunit ribosomal protein S3|nr:30S ribosomal protein S3 [Candidatus Poseidoniaceae archaeon]MDP7001640.1 30S ribosomal protein S3 [Candidatus Poseidoniaceae archaeon]